MGAITNTGGFAGAGTLNVTGAGVLTIAGGYTQTGSTTINNGALIVANATSVVVVSSGTVASSLVVSSGTLVQDYGTMVSAAVQSGGEVDIYSGGLTRSSTVSGWTAAGQMSVLAVSPAT